MDSGFVEDLLSGPAPLEKFLQLWFWWQCFALCPSWTSHVVLYGSPTVESHLQGDSGPTSLAE